MSSQSDQEHSSSSPIDGNSHRREHRGNRSRSRSRDKHRHRYDRDDGKMKGNGRKQRVIKLPQFSNQLISFRAFMLNQAESISNEKAEKQYQAYKAQWEQKSNSAFFMEHKGQAWFQQRYNPQILDVIQRERKENVLAVSQQFFSDFKNGKYRAINLSVEDPNRLGFVCNDREQQGDEIRQSTTANNNFGVPVHLQTLDINASNNLNITQEPFFGFDPDTNTLFIKAIPRSISRYDIFQVVGKLEGFKNITLSDPVKKMSFARYCWIAFKDDQCLKSAETRMNGITIKEQPISFGHSISKAKRIKVLKNYPLGRIQTDAQITKKLAQRLDRQVQITQNPLMAATFQNSKQQFDTFLLYLRRVHAYDYFTSTSYFNERTLCLKLGLCYLRTQIDQDEIQGIPTVFKKMEEEAKNIIENGLNTSTDHMKVLREQIEKLLIKVISDQQKIPLAQVKQRTAWSCMYCDKRFRSCQFLAKHVISKHTQIKEKQIQGIMEQTYYKDSKKITNHQTSREDRENNKGKRQNYKRDRRRDYRDLDEPEGGSKTERSGPKQIINFLDI